MEAHERQIRIYRPATGATPFLDWLNALRDQRAKQKIDARLARIRLGNLGNTRSVGDGVHELKIDYGPGYRVYFAHDGLDIVLLLCGGDKNTQPQDIRDAQQYWTAYKREKPMPTVDYKEDLLHRLKDPDYAAGYLTAAIEEGDDAFLLAVRDVAQAQGGIASLAQATKLNRENLYDMLSKDGNPRLSSLSTILETLGFQVTFRPKNPEAA